tara:strand:+ start:94 stop:279 length:186 start_codon:yes stop_codon:yes gene_type:complete
MKEMEQLIDKITTQAYIKIYNLVDHEMEYSDIDFEPDASECVKDHEQAHDYIMNQVINKLK